MAKHLFVNCLLLSCDRFGRSAGLSSRSAARIQWYTGVKACVNTIMVLVGFKSPPSFKVTPKKTAAVRLTADVEAGAEGAAAAAAAKAKAQVRSAACKQRLQEQLMPARVMSVLSFRVVPKWVAAMWPKADVEAGGCSGYREG